GAGIRLEHFGLHGGRREPVIAWEGVPLTPEAEQPHLDEPEARVAVVALSEGANEVTQRLAQARVLVVWGAAPAGFLLGIGGAAQPRVQQEAGHAGRQGRVVQVEADDGLVASARGGVERAGERVPGGAVG